MTARAIGGHHSAAAGSTTWLTPPEIIAELGGWPSFDLDPCAAPSQPWRTARRMNTLADADGLALEWDGRVWGNFPYGAALALWLARLADHNRGTALMFARTETDAFQRHVWAKASGLLFIAGRLHFHYPDGTRAKANSGAPSVLAAYGQDDLDRLAASKIPGALVPLRFARAVLIAGIDQSWSEAVRGWLRRQRGPVSVSDAYRFFARHPRSSGNPNWKAKVRQKMRQVGNRVAHDRYEGIAA